MRAAFKYKMYHSENNERLNRKRIVASAIYNRCIAMHKRYYRLTGKYLNQSRLKKRVAYLRNNLHPEWKLLGSQAVQDVIERIDRGYQLFFKSLKAKSGRKVRPPSFKKTVKYRSFTLKQAGWKLIGPGKIRIGKKAFRFHQHREIPGAVKTVTIGRDAVGDFWVSFSVDLGRIAPHRVMTGKTAGFDFGLKQFLTDQIGRGISMPEFFKADAKALRKASRRLSRTQKGSSGRRKARLALARLHRAVQRRRQDFHFKLARQLAETYDVICLEDLNLKGMQALWGRKVSDYGFASFVSILEFQCKKLGSKLVKVDRFYPSSKTCSACGEVHKGLGLRDRSWPCPHCEAVHDRDRNAAINIHREGLRLLGDHRGHTVEKEAA